MWDARFWICLLDISLSFLLVDGEILCVSVKRLAQVCLRLSRDPWTACSVKHIKDPHNKSNLLPPPKPSAGHYSGIDYTCLSLISNTRVQVTWNQHGFAVLIQAPALVLNSSEMPFWRNKRSLPSWCNHSLACQWFCLIWRGFLLCNGVCVGWLKRNDSRLNTDHHPHALHTA